MMSASTIIEVETNDLSTENDDVIQLAVLPFDYDAASGRILTVHKALAFEGLREPVVPISEAASLITGIANDKIVGRSMDDAAEIRQTRDVGGACSYISGDLAERPDDRCMEHVRNAPCHPQTQGKIARWHQTPKNRILLENDDLPGDLEAQVDAFVVHDNHRRCHESLGNPTPADAYFGRAQTIPTAL